ncbi:chemotaxis protein CheW [Desulfonema ishimotonii]|uniref:Chemotaxis protein CheW n=1 Tax=Desulfonema ishimotonii TaxID=45657 RepID=A0A401FT47_9BACT|nr:chemotaxis protein CheW [Desulfonema ishimotonii]GBC60124.1 chemotaxis protein CheW [Desulfonema ishimotonii]
MGEQQQPEKNKAERILAQIRDRKRDEALAEAEAEMVRLVIFTLGKDYYGFYGNHIREILTFSDIACVPGCPEYIMGIINVRGDIESVLSPNRLMGLPEAEITPESRILLAVAGDLRSGILVDTVKDVTEVSARILKQPISTLNPAVREFAVAGETLYDGNYVTVLDISKIFQKMVS